jgi:parvulin-like peptidyl-prolyl isomerase
MPESEAASAEGRRKLEEMRQDLLDKMISEKLVVQAAERAGEDTKDKGRTAGRPNPYLPTDDELDQEADKAYDEIRLRYPGDAAFKDELKRLGRTVEGFKSLIRARVRSSLISQRMIKAKEKEFQSQFSISDDEARSFYSTHAQQFGSGASVRLRHILVAGDEAGAALLAKIKKRLQAGESFAVLASENSRDALTKGKGGMLGWIEKGQLEWPELEKAAFSAKPGQVAGPVRTKRGLHLILVEESKSGEKKEFVQVRNQVVNTLYSQKMHERVDAWVAQLKQKTYVEVTP